jgi:hypothetical protein
MTDDAIDKARERLREAAEGRPDAAAVDAVLERARAQVEELAQTAAELESTIPAKVEHAVSDGLAEQVRPVGRNLAEIRGLMNQVIRRLERAEGDLLSERHARVDDLALLVDLIAAGWKGVEARLDRIERKLDGGDVVALPLAS